MFQGVCLEGEETVFPLIKLEDLIMDNLVVENKNTEPAQSNSCEIKKKIAE